MSSYGQFCAIARSLEVLGGRWTLLVIREIYCGSRRFNEIRRGIPRISKTVLSDRLQKLTVNNVIECMDGRWGPEYLLSESGKELVELIGVLGRWGQKWLERDATNEDLDLEPVLGDMARRVDFNKAPNDPTVIRFELVNFKPRFLLIKLGETSVCNRNPGFPEALTVRSELPVLVSWWRGDIDFLQAQRQGMEVEGVKSFARSFPKWFFGYRFCNVKSAL